MNNKNVIKQTTLLGKRPIQPMSEKEQRVRLSLVTMRQLKSDLTRNTALFKRTQSEYHYRQIMKIRKEIVSLSQTLDHLRDLK